MTDLASSHLSMGDGGTAQPPAPRCSSSGHRKGGRPCFQCMNLIICARYWLRGGRNMWIKAILLGALASVAVFGQTSGEITGEVKDTAGAVVVGARVTVTNAST